MSFDLEFDNVVLEGYATQEQLAECDRRVYEEEQAYAALRPALREAMEAWKEGDYGRAAWLRAKHETRRSEYRLALRRTNMAIAQLVSELKGNS